MDAQRKKGILEVCVLAVLKKGASYGYQIIRELEQCIEVSESTLYPILKRLEQNGSLKTYRQAYNGRMRKYYELTPEGQRRIDQFLEEWDEMRGMYQFVAQQNAAADVKSEPEPENLVQETGTGQAEEVQEPCELGTAPACGTSAEQIGGTQEPDESGTAPACGTSAEQIGGTQESDESGIAPACGTSTEQTVWVQEPDELGEVPAGDISEEADDKVQAVEADADTAQVREEVYE